MDKEISIASTTFANKAKAIECARKVIEKDLAACAQVHGPIISIYQWEGKVCEDVEWKVELKVSPSKVRELQSTIMQNHEYDVPQWYFHKASASKDYSRWVKTGN